jgi:hypothetical protein
MAVMGNQPVSSANFLDYGKLWSCTVISCLPLREYTGCVWTRRLKLIHTVHLPINIKFQNTILILRYIYIIIKNAVVEDNYNGNYAHIRISLYIHLFLWHNIFFASTRKRIRDAEYPGSVVSVQCNISLYNRKRWLRDAGLCICYVKALFHCCVSCARQGFSIQTSKVYFMDSIFFGKL